MLPENARYIIERLNAHGFEAYAVGGCVRDRLLGKCPEDWDITTAALPQEIQAVFSEFHLNLKGLKHGTVGIIRHGTMTEVTTYRIDGAYSDSRRPDSVSFTSLLNEDLARRDFTVNAMAMDINENIIDIFNGENDLKNKLIRCVGDPVQRLSEDALRIMRGLRFASLKGFSLEENTLNACNLLAERLTDIAYERIYTELKKMLALENAPFIMERTLPVFKAVFPTLNTADWPAVCERIKKRPCRPTLALAVILLSSDVSAELTRLKVEKAVKKRILTLKQLLDFEIKNDRQYLQRLMCAYTKEDVLFLCEYLSCTTDVDFNSAGKKAAEGIADIRQLAVNGVFIKELGFKSYKIKEALDTALEGVISERCENTPESIAAYLKNSFK